MTYGAATDDQLAQAVFAHEIGHNLVGVLGKEEWIGKYRDMVPRREGTWGDVDNYYVEQEAVTMLGLYVLGRDYGQEDQHRKNEIDNWTQEILKALSNYGSP